MLRLIELMERLIHSHFQFGSSDDFLAPKVTNCDLQSSPELRVH
jgi:hypothetical protein